MAQEYGAAQGLMDWAKDKYDKMESGLGLLRKAGDALGGKEKPKDDPWHDSMVKRANESFRKASEKKPVRKKMPRKR